MVAGVATAVAYQTQAVRQPPADHTTTADHTCQAATAAAANATNAISGAVMLRAFWALPPTRWVSGAVNGSVCAAGARSEAVASVPSVSMIMLGSLRSRLADIVSISGSALTGGRLPARSTHSRIR